MEIRDCGTADFEMVFPLLGQLWPDLETDPRQMRDAFAACLDAEGQVLFCAVEVDRIAGFCAIIVKESLWRQGRTAFVDVLVVDGELRGRGIGATLLERAGEIAGSRGCDYIELDSSFHREGAHRFYEKQGFVRTGYLFGRRLDDGA